jgi:hypothetical protein
MGGLDASREDGLTLAEAMMKAADSPGREKRQRWFDYAFAPNQVNPWLNFSSCPCSSSASRLEQPWSP